MVEGEFRPGGIGGTEWCDASVLRLLRRRSLAALRKEVEPVAAGALARFLPAWQHVGGTAAGRRRLAPGGRAARRVRRSGRGAGDADPARSDRRTTRPALLDELTAAGEVLWTGHGSLPGKDGWVALHLADACPAHAARPGPMSPRPAVHDW